MAELVHIAMELFGQRIEGYVSADAAERIRCDLELHTAHSPPPAGSPQHETAEPSTEQRNTQ
jgi:hypothetical protein